MRKLEQLKSEKAVKVSLVVYNSQMFLRISAGEEIVNLPYAEAAKFVELLKALVPYQHGQVVWFHPIKFTGYSEDYILKYER